MAKNDKKTAFFILSTSHRELLAKVINTHVNYKWGYQHNFSRV